MKYLVVGLGNKGDKYENTRHNIGFKVADALVDLLEGKFENASFGLLAKCKYKGRQVLVLKPDTYMNLSGNAVKYWMQKEKIPLENILIITDDLHLPFGTVRIKQKGSSAGHNGLKSIEEQLQSQKYPRLRFGIGNEFTKGNQIDFVLGEWDIKEAPTLNKRILFCVEACQSFIFTGISNTMNQFNGK
ncbi:MAG: aminoacyl-tRNA hydrolase [Flavobacteriales bacterium]|nr:aminoacyl-tRNA hydrolase [Flavobacteriales bacterium]